jgi:tetratricopeptide (TPR) repeat protein
VVVLMPETEDDTQGLLQKPTPVRRVGRPSLRGNRLVLRMSASYSAREESGTPFAPWQPMRMVNEHWWSVHCVLPDVILDAALITLMPAHFPRIESHNPLSYCFTAGIVLYCDPILGGRMPTVVRTTMSEPANPRQRAAQLIDEGIAAIRAGDQMRARQLLSQAVQLDPQNERGWLWLSGALPDAAQRRYCLERVLAINPQNEVAKRGLASLTSAAPPAAPSASAPKPTTPPRSQPVFDPLAPDVTAKRDRPTGAPSPSASVTSSPPPAPRPSAQATGSAATATPESAESARRAASTIPLPDSAPPATPKPAEPRQRLPESSPAASPVDPLASLRPGSGAKRSSLLRRPGVPGKIETSATPTDTTTVQPKKRSRTLIIALLGVLVVVALLIVGSVYLYPELLAPLRSPEEASAPTAEPEPASPTPVPTPTSIPTATPLPTPTPADVRELIREANELAASGSLGQAVERYTEAIRADPSSFEAYFGRAQVNFNLSLFQSAIDDFTKALALDPDNVEAYHQRARAFYRLNQYDAAIRDFTEALERDPNNDVILMRRGVAYRDNRQYDEALADFDQSLQLNPDVSFTYYHRALLFQATGKLDRARADFDRALTIAPEYRLAFVGRGLLRLEQRDARGALSDCSRAIELDATEIDAYLCRARAAIALKDYRTAIADLDVVIARDPDNADAYRERGRAHQALRDVTEARADYQRAAELYRVQGRTEDLAEVEKLLAALR